MMFETHVKPIVRGMDFGKLELTLSRLWQTSRWSWLVTNPSLNALFLGRQEKARCTQIIQANIDIAIKAHVIVCRFNRLMTTYMYDCYKKSARRTILPGNPCSIWFKDCLKTDWLYKGSEVSEFYEFHRSPNRLSKNHFSYQHLKFAEISDLRSTIVGSYNPKKNLNQYWGIYCEGS